jgi:hypothetical protein
MFPLWELSQAVTSITLDKNTVLYYLKFSRYGSFLGLVAISGRDRHDGLLKQSVEEHAA